MREKIDIGNSDTAVMKEKGVQSEEEIRILKRQIKSFEQMQVYLDAKKDEIQKIT